MRLRFCFTIFLVHILLNAKAANEPPELVNGNVQETVELEVWNWEEKEVDCKFDDDYEVKVEAPNVQSIKDGIMNVVVTANDKSGNPVDGNVTVVLHFYPYIKEVVYNESFNMVKGKSSFNLDVRKYSDYVTEENPYRMVTVQAKVVEQSTGGIHCGSTELYITLYSYKMTCVNYEACSFFKPNNEQDVLVEINNVNGSNLNDTKSTVKLMYNEVPRSSSPPSEQATTTFTFEGHMNETGFVNFKNVKLPDLPESDHYVRYYRVTLKYLDEEQVIGYVSKHEDTKEYETYNPELINGNNFQGTVEMDSPGREEQGDCKFDDDYEVKVEASNKQSIKDGIMNVVVTANDKSGNPVDGNVTVVLHFYPYIKEDVYNESFNMVKGKSTFNLDVRKYSDYVTEENPYRMVTVQAKVVEQSTGGIHCGSTDIYITLYSYKMTCVNYEACSFFKPNNEQDVLVEINNVNGSNLNDTKSTVKLMYNEVPRSSSPPSEQATTTFTFEGHMNETGFVNFKNVKLPDLPESDHYVRYYRVTLKYLDEEQVIGYVSKHEDTKEYETYNPELINGNFQGTVEMDSPGREEQEGDCKFDDDYEVKVEAPDVHSIKDGIMNVVVTANDKSGNPVDGNVTVVLHFYPYIKEVVYNESFNMVKGKSSFNLDIRKYSGYMTEAQYPMVEFEAKVVEQSTGSIHCGNTDVYITLYSYEMACVNYEDCIVFEPNNEQDVLVQITNVNGSSLNDTKSTVKLMYKEVPRSSSPPSESATTTFTFEGHMNETGFVNFKNVKLPALPESEHNTLNYSVTLKYLDEERTIHPKEYETYM